MGDLRMPALGAAAWAGGLLGLLAPAPVLVGVLLALVLLLAALRRRAGALVGAACLMAAAATAGTATLHVAGLGGGPVAALAEDRAVVSVELIVTSDPRPVQSAYDDLVVLRGRVTRVVGRGAAHRVSTPVVVLAGEEWLEVPLGTRVASAGRLGPAEGDAAGLLRVRGRPDVREGPDLWWRAAARVRASIRDAVAPRSEHARVLVPALVVGDDAGMDPALAEDFRTTGLTHLLAVSEIGRAHV